MQQWLRQWYRPLFVGLIFVFAFLIYLSTLLSHTTYFSDAFVNIAIFTLFTLIVIVLSSMGYLIYYFWNKTEVTEREPLPELPKKRHKKVNKAVVAPVLKEEKCLSIKQIQDKKYRGFEFLERMEEEELFKYIEIQHPQIIVMVILMIDQEKSIKLLEAFEPVLAEKISKIVASNVNLLPSQVEKLDLALQEELLELYTECRILKKLEDSEIRQLLHQVNKKELMFALKGATQELQERFLANMSPNTSAWFHNLLVHAPQVSQENSDKAIKKLYLLAKQLRENGRIRATN